MNTLATLNRPTPKKRPSRFIKSLATLAFSGCITGWLTPSIYAQDYIQGEILPISVPQVIETQPLLPQPIYAPQTIYPSTGLVPNGCSSCPSPYPMPQNFAPVYGNVIIQSLPNAIPEYPIGEVVIGQTGVISGPPVVNGYPIPSIPMSGEISPIYPSTIDQYPQPNYSNELPMEGVLYGATVAGEVILSESPSLTSPSDTYQGSDSPFGSSEAEAKLREEIERSEAEVADLKTVIAELKVDLKGANERVYATERKFKASLSKANTELDELSAEVKKLTEEKTALQNELAKTELKMATAAANQLSNEKLTAELDATKQQLAALSKQQKSAIKKLKAEQQKQIETQLAGSEKNIADLKSQLLLAQQKISLQATQVQNSKKEALEAKERADKMTAQLREQIKRSESKLKADLAAAEKRHSELVREQEAKVRELAKMRALAEKERAELLKKQKDANRSPKRKPNGKSVGKSDVQQRLKALRDHAAAKVNDTKKPDDEGAKKKHDSKSDHPKTKQADAKKGKGSDSDSAKKGKKKPRFNVDEQIKKLEKSRQRQVEKVTRESKTKEKSMLKELGSQGIGKDHPDAKQKLRELNDRLQRRIDEIQKRVDDRIKRVREEARRRAAS